MPVGSVNIVGLMEPTLCAFADGRLLFSSDRKWLYPLFDLEAFLTSQPHQRRDLEVHDKIVGRAAALFLVRLGVGSVCAGVLSKPGREVLERYGIPFTCGLLVERIACQTEELLCHEWDPDKAVALLRARVQSQALAADGVSPRSPP